MVATNVEARPAVSNGAHQNCFEWTVVVGGFTLWRFDREVIGEGDHIEHGGSEVCDGHVLLVCHIAGHRQRLEIHLGTHHRAADIEHHPAFELGDSLGQDQKVGVTCSAHRCTITVWVFVDDVLADAHMDGDGDS